MPRIARPLLILALGSLALSACTPKSKDASATIAPKTSVQPLAGPEVIQNPLVAPKVYTDGVSVAVELVALKPIDDDGAHALLRITGIRNRIAGVTFLVRRIQQGGEDAWSTTIDGRSVNLLVARQHQSLSDEEPVLYVLRGSGPVQLHSDREAAEKIDVDELIADYRSHLADGSIDALAKFDRDYAKQGVTSAIDLRRAEFAQHCGKELAVEVDWNSLPKREDFDKASFCDYAVQKLAMMCEDGLSNKLEIVAKLDRLDCALSDDENYSYVAATKSLRVASTEKAVRKGATLATAISKNLDLQRTVAKTDKGLYLVFPTQHEENPGIYAGAGLKLFRQYGKISGSRTVVSTWNGVEETGIRMTGPGTWRALCPAEEVEFTEVAFDERDRVLKSASFEQAIWKRHALLLARDNQGNYYFVDRLRPNFGGLGYRVFKGPRGRLNLTTMVDIVDDARGKIFATTSGSLRLLVADGGQSAQWLIGKKSEKLAIIEGSSMDRLVYGDLGIYAGQELGTICSFAATSEIGP